MDNQVLYFGTVDAHSCDVDQELDDINAPGVTMITIAGLLLFASTTNLSSVQVENGKHASVTHPVFAEAPKVPNGLTLYNEKGEVVARCEKKDDTFRDCKIESGVTLDDLMNAWVHAYLDVQK